MPDDQELLAEIRDRVALVARGDSRTPIDGLLVSRIETSEPDHQLTEPLFVLMAQGGKRLYFERDAIEYGGECLIVTTSIPLSGHFIDARPERPALAVGLRLRPSVIAALLPTMPHGLPDRRGAQRAVGTCTAESGVLDAVARMLRLVDAPSDARVLAPMIEREICWRLLTGPMASSVAQIGSPDSNLARVSRSIAWIRENYAEPLALSQLATGAGMSRSTFHRHFRGVTGFTPLQFQKQLRLHEARSLLLARASDVTGVAHRVGYSSPTQFSREYRRLFGAPPRRDVNRLRIRIR